MVLSHVNHFWLLSVGEAAVEGPLISVLPSSFLLVHRGQTAEMKSTTHRLCGMIAYLKNLYERT
jgi:hypothetical protein